MNFKSILPALVGTQRSVYPAKKIEVSGRWNRAALIPAAAGVPSSARPAAAGGRSNPNPESRKTISKIPTVAETASTSSDPPQQPLLPPWIELPGDVTANILQRLNPEEILESAQKVCTTWRKVCQDPAMWRVIDFKTWIDAFDEYDLMCRCAVDRSQGQLMDISIAFFGDDKLLNYIVDRSSHLRRLTLASCDDISENALAEAVKKLPQLEELHLIMMPFVHAKDVETIGISSPMLKSFTFNELYNKHPEFSEDDEHTEVHCCNEYALAIGKNMPNLRHLRLVAHLRMKNEGLQAILDGCPHLESLDLRRCFGLDLRGALGERCSEQIKDLRGPSDSISDSEWSAGESSDVDWGSSISSFSRFSDFSYDGYLDDYDYDYDYYDDCDGYDDL
ncbi:hypothetical protein C2S51_011892 [Perilla frutescens var. frutescens]|nr:hypothetical protein C2S51_011892 [Perilla frutescens var. frutescens]